MGQIAKPCKCPKNIYVDQIKPDTAFYFSNNKSIILCGYKDTETIENEIIFSEFILANCSTKSVIDFWGSLKKCRVLCTKDTLLIEELKNLPAGENMSFKQTVWTIEKIYFVNDKINRKLFVNKNIRKYSNQEIQSVLLEYESRKPGHFEGKEVLLYHLFISTISGSTQARKYFNEFKNKFEIHKGDGAMAEESNELIKMLHQWDSNTK